MTYVRWVYGDFWWCGVCQDGRCADVDDVLPDGHRLKKGDGVYYLSYAMGRMPYIWGEDAEEFRPERWLKNGEFQPESPFKFIAFHVRNFFKYICHVSRRLFHPMFSTLISWILTLTFTGWSSDLFGQGLRLQANEDIRNHTASLFPLQIGGWSKKCYLQDHVHASHQWRPPSASYF